MQSLSILVPAVIMTGLTMYGNVIFSSKPPPVDIMQLPLNLGDYRGVEQKINSDITEGTAVTDDRSIIYMNSSYSPIHMYLGYYRTKRNQSAFVHSPDSCLPGSGWKTLKREIIPLDAGKSKNKVIKYVSEMGATRQILITWIQSGKITATDHRQMILNALYNSMYKLQFDDATKVMISTVIGSGETEKEAQKRLLDFVHKFYPVFIELAA
jgi:EpsI family protein